MVLNIISASLWIHMNPWRHFLQKTRLQRDWIVWRSGFGPQKIKCTLIFNVGPGTITVWRFPKLWPLASYCHDAGCLTLLLWESLNKALMPSFDKLAKCPHLPYIYFQQCMWFLIISIFLCELSCCSSYLYISAQHGQLTSHDVILSVYGVLLQREEWESEWERESEREHRK